MKWGVRKQRKSSSRSSPLKRSSSNKSKAKTKPKPKRKKIKDMTNSELIKRRERLRLEKEVRILDEETGSAARRIGRKAVSKAAEQVVSEVIHDVAKYAAASVINNYAGVKVVNLKTSDEKKNKKDN